MTGQILWYNEDYLEMARIGSNRAMSSLAVVFQEQLRIPLGLNSLARFRRWARSEEFPERGVSYIGGNIEVDMSPEELNHNKVKSALHALLWPMVESEELGDLFVDGVLVSNVQANLSTVPDIVFVSFDSLRNGKVHYKESSVGTGRYVEIVGSPDAVVEVVSQTSVRKDTASLREAYCKAGVQEYWLVDSRGEEVELQILRRAGGDDWLVSEGVWQVSGVFSRKFRITQTRDRLGGRRYRLEGRRVR